ncbi:hypothetical protein [Methanobacterium ferruginis]|uniref:hypothetical protein n=1 Tax=Methanobacterium ferruginis TaxID=710191 RepID=UPI0025736E4E|nr:hypothetical protein [Methanobacterium ferruginis]BDZ66754.1 hypothetical protein GCM10025860_02020 [Methanobacterium ferruginis]
MPELGPLGRGGARRRTRRRMTRANNIANQELEEKEGGQQPEVVTQPDNSDKLKKLAKLLKDKGVISETEYNLIFK